jgi:hypothetical protein
MLGRAISPDIEMDASVECIHCKVVMTSWSAPGSPIRYYQCPFCTRTHSSLYGEVFRRRAGARLLDPAPRPAAAAAGAAGIPMASPEDVRWAQLKATAARWFARVEADQRRVAADHPAPPVRAARRAPASAEPVREVDPGDVVEVGPSRGVRRAR